MATYVILSKMSSGAISDPKEFKHLAAKVTQKIKDECPGVDWQNSYATMGQYDVVDVVNSDDPKQVEKAAMIIRSYGHSSTATLVATPWHKFLESL